MCNIEDIYLGQTFILKWKQGKKTVAGDYSIISKVPDGRVALLEMEDEKTPLVKDGSSWLCKVTMIFEHKIVVQAIENCTESNNNNNNNNTN